MSDRHKVCLIGCGIRGQHHAFAFRALEERFDLAAVCDLDAQKLESFAQRFGIARTYSDANQMLGTEKPEVLCFATMPTIRFPLVELGVKHGVKLIAFEKPMALDLPEAARIQKVCADAGVEFVVSHQQKYGANWQAAKALVDAGEIGEVQQIHATARAWMSEMGTHLIDYMIWFNGGSRVDWVVGQAVGTRMLDVVHASPDFAVGTMRFANGVRGFIECGALAPRFIPGDSPLGTMPFFLDDTVTVTGSEGYVRVVTEGRWEAVTRSSKGKVIGNEAQDGFDLDPEALQVPYVAEIADVLDGRTNRHVCNGDATYHGFQVMMALYVSAVEHRRVSLPLDPLPHDSVLESLRRSLAIADEYAGQ